MKLYKSRNCNPCRAIEGWIDNMQKLNVFPSIERIYVEDLETPPVKTVPALIDGDNVLIGLLPILEYLRGILNEPNHNG